MNSRVILHVDMNAYFASIEQKANPFLRGKPIVVVADSRRRSVIMTASYQARAYGIRTGMNLHEARQLYPKVIAVDGNSAKYLDSTAQIMAVLGSFSDQVEMFSCDEAYLDVTGSMACFGMDGEGIGAMVKEKVKSVTGLPCSVGVAPNKLLAKLASEKKKPDGLTVIRPEEVEQFLAVTAVDELCGIGDKLKQRLNRLGIKNCAQLGRMDEGLMFNYFGFWGHWLKRMGQGKDDTPVKKSDVAETVKSVGHSTTFPRDSSDTLLLQSYLLLLCEKIAFRLRQGRLLARTITLVVRYKDFETFSRQESIRTHTDDGYDIYLSAFKILQTFRPFPHPVRLLGVSCSELAANHWQEYLLEALTRKRTLNHLCDGLNKKYGRKSIRPASLIIAEKFGVLEAPIPPTIHRFR